MDLLSASGWLISLHSPGAAPSVLRPDLVLAVGWVAAEAAAVSLPSVPRLVDAAEVQFLLAARRALAGSASPTPLDDRFGHLLRRELTAYARANGVTASFGLEADLLDDFLGRPGWVDVVPPAAGAEAPNGADRRGLVLLADLDDEVDADAAAWIEQQVVPLIPRAALARDPLVVASATPALASARLVLVPPLLGARGYEVAVRALACVTPVVAPARVAASLPPPVRTHVHAADRPDDFVHAVAEALRSPTDAVPSTIRGAMLNAHSPDLARTTLLAAMERAVRVADERAVV